MKAGRWIWASVALLAVVAVAPVAANDTPVVLQVQSKSWINGSAFDPAPLNDRCREAGIALVAPGVRGNATAVVTYAETKGPGFSMFGVGEPVGFGTNIAFKLTLLGSGGRTLASVNAAGETPAGEPKERFHESARAALVAAPAYEFACATMAAALGSRAQALRLLPWAVLDAQAVALLDRLAFVAETPGERAYLAVARRDFSAAQALAPASFEPLLLLFENSGDARQGIGVFPLTADNVRTLTRALPILAFARDERVADVLVTFLNDYTDYRGRDDSQVVPLLRLVIQTLGKVGTLFTIPVLDEWRAGNGPLAADATAAVTAIRGRVSID